MQVKNIDQIELGRHLIDTWYFSPFPPEFRDCKVGGPAGSAVGGGGAPRGAAAAAPPCLRGSPQSMGCGRAGWNASPPSHAHTHTCSRSVFPHCRLHTPTPTAKLSLSTPTPAPLESPAARPSPLPPVCLQKLFFCEYTLQFFKRRSQMLRHLSKVRTRHPPGDEIYRNGNVCMFEVSGMAGGPWLLAAGLVLSRSPAAPPVCSPQDGVRPHAVLAAQRPGPAALDAAHARPSPTLAWRARGSARPPGASRPGLLRAMALSMAPAPCVPPMRPGGRQEGEELLPEPVLPGQAVPGPQDAVL